MKYTRLIISGLLITALLILAACAGMPTKQEEVTTRIIGRRLGYHGVQLYPQYFLAIAPLAKEACAAATADAPTPEAVFTLISKQVYEKIPDKLLIEDIKDISQLMGLDLDQDYQITNITEPIRERLKTFLCALADGVEQGQKL